MGELSAILVVVLLILSCAKQVKSSLSNHRYNFNDPVPLYGNKVGPFHINPSETYAYYDLPFCSPDHPVEKEWSLGDVLNGDRFISTPYKLEFRIDKDFEVACTKTLTKKEIKKFQYAIDRSYGVQMCYDDFLVLAPIGRIDYFNPTHIRPREMGRNEIYLGHSQFRSFYGRVDYNAKREDYAYRFFSHINFQISYNNERVTRINALADEFSDNVVELKEDKEVQVRFSYSVRWHNRNDSFEKSLYEYYSGGDRDWSSALESSFLVLVLLGCTLSVYAVVLQELHNTRADNIENVEKQEEISICCPKHKSLFAASIGCGTQMIVLVFFTLMVGLFRYYPYKRGALRTGLVATYVITSGVAGYASSSLYSQLHGTNWVQNIMLTGSLFNVPLFVTFSIINYVAVIYKVTSALAFGTILVLLFIWVFGALPLLLLGGIIAKNKGFEYNTRHYNATRSPEYSQLPWYKMGVAGLFSFGVMYTEFFYLLSSIWGQNRIFGGYIYTTYPILLIVATVTVIVTGSVTVALSYTQLCIENSEWQWRSFFTGGSTGFYVFGYCLYYYHQCTNMSGMLQTLVFVGYMACVSYGLFLLLGTVGFYASLLFVRYKHGSTKRE